jgi:hypothetical protein
MPHESSELTASPVIAPGLHTSSRAHALLVANASLLAGAILVSVSPALASNWPVFILFVFGHVIWSWHSLPPKRSSSTPPFEFSLKGFLRSAISFAKDNPLLSLNASLLFFDLWAILVRFFG